MSEDARIQPLRDAMRALQPVRVTGRSDHAEAAVVLVVRPADELEVLFIRRAERPGDPWSGHVAFPGGRRSESDPDLVATAFREAEEETGLALARVGSLLGPLDEVPTTRQLPPYVISPFVVAVPASAAVTPDLEEVVQAEWVPLGALRDPDSVSELRIERGGIRLTFPTVVYRDYVIWGLTHRIMGRFLEVVAAAGL